MATRNVSVRLSSDGAGKVKADLQGVGEAGGAAMERLARTASLAVKAFVGFQLGRIVTGWVRDLRGFAEVSIDWAGALSDSAEQLGLTIESLQRYEFAASQVGVENEKLRDAFDRLNVVIGDALKGDENASRLFADLGVSLLDAQGLTRGTEAVFRDLVDAIAAIEDPAQRSAALADVLGRRLGPDLVNLVNLGTEGLDELGRTADELGLVFGGKTIREIDDVGDAIGDLGKVIVSAGRTIVFDLLPSAEAIRAFTRDVAGFFEAAIDGFRRFFGLQPDFDDTLDQIRERAIELGIQRGRIAEHERDLERIRREQPAAVAAATLALNREKAAAAELEAELAGLRQRYDEVAKQKAALGGTAPGAGLPAPEDPEKTEREAKALRQVVEALDAEAAARRRRDETLATLEANREGLGEARYLDLVARANQQYADALAALPGGLKEVQAEEQRRAQLLQQLHAQLDPAAAANDRFAETMRRIGQSGVQGEERVRLMSAAVLQWSKDLDEATGVAERNRQAEEERQRLMEAGAAVFAATRTAAERYAIELDRLAALYEAGAINAETFERAVQDLNEDLDDQDDKLNELTRAIEGFGRRTADTFGDVLVGLDDINDSFDRLIQTLASEIISQLLYRNVFGPLVDLAGGLGGDGGAFGWLADLFGFRRGAAFDDGRLVPLARGGVVDRPTLFPMANGMGLMGERGPEAVLPLRRAANGDLGVAASGGGVVINIIDRRGAGAPPVRTRERQGPGGLREIDLYIEERVERAIGRGRFDQSLGDAFGSRRAPVMR